MLYVSLDVNGSCSITLADLTYYGKLVADQSGKDNALRFKWCALFEPNIETEIMLARRFHQKKIN